MAGFDPYLQPVRFLASDGKTPIAIPISDIDRFNEESVSICLNYGAQFGACIVMLLVFLVSTPSSKFRGPSTILYIIALVICVIRMALLGAFFPSPLNEFYNYWAVDYSAVPIHHFRVSVAGNVSSLLLVVAIEAALVNQAWVMLSLWPSVAKYIFSSISFSVTLLTIGWRMVYTILLSKAVFSAESARPIRWVSKWAIITNTVSICWFCALFNVKLVVHLIAHRGVLPPCRTLTPIEVLIMTNGILMVVPVIFTGLEWGHWANFEAASLTLTSVALMLPLGTLAAQRLSQSYGLEYHNSGYRSDSNFPGSTNDSKRPLKVVSSTTTSRTGTTPQVSVLTGCEAGTLQYVLDREGLELSCLDDCSIYNGKARVNQAFEPRDDRL